MKEKKFCKTCGKEVKYSKTGYCRSCYVKSDEGRKKNSEGLKTRHKDPNFGHLFTTKDRTKSQQTQHDRYIKEIVDSGSFSFRSNDAIKNYLLKDFGWENKCAICGIDSWMNNPIGLELDHIDGNHHKNTFENLRLLCPNCHSQTDTFKGRNMNTGTFKVSDEALTGALLSEKNISCALASVGLSPKGANYARAYKLLEIVNKN